MLKRTITRARTFLGHSQNIFILLLCSENVYQNTLEASRQECHFAISAALIESS